MKNWGLPPLYADLWLVRGATLAPPDQRGPVAIQHDMSVRVGPCGSMWGQSLRPFVGKASEIDNQPTNQPLLGCKKPSSSVFVVGDFCFVLVLCSTLPMCLGIWGVFSGLVSPLRAIHGVKLTPSSLPAKMRQVTSSNAKKETNVTHQIGMLAPNLGILTNRISIPTFFGWNQTLNSLRSCPKVEQWKKGPGTVVGLFVGYI